MALAPRPAWAHFLFIYIGPAAEAGRSAEVYFSESAQAGDPAFIDKIAHTQLWVQSTPGEFQQLKVHRGADRLRAHLPSKGSVAVVGECQYGVIARTNQVPFLLRHYPKAIAGKADDLNRMQPRREIPFEVMATIDGDAVAFTALVEGKPVANATFTTVDEDLKNEEFSADDHGRATWTPPAPGKYSVYTRRAVNESGEFGGKKYEQVREFATIAFTWPLERRGPDTEAVALFEEALATRSQWKNFPGFKAQIAGVVDDRPFDGSVTVDATGAVNFQTSESTAEPWVKDQLESIAMHRIASSSDSARSDAKPVLRFADDQTQHPLGRLLLFEGGSFASSYRVKDKQIMVVNRRMGRQNMTITVLDNDRNAEGLYLPRSYTVQYWDGDSGTLQRTETIQDRWTRVGTWDLPASHTVTNASETGLSVKHFVLTDHRLLQK
jgi:hypothetical protein